jgi:hydrogenase maturation protease
MIVAEAPAVVIGVGNVLLRDDGAGVRAVEALRALAARDPSALPAETRLLDGGTLGLGLLPDVRGARSLLLLDAVDLDLPAGSVRVLRGDGIEAAGSRWGGSAEPGVGELLAVARLMGWLPDQVALVGIQVDEVGFGIGLSEPVEAALPLAVEAARRELRDPGRQTPEGATA